MVIGSSSTAHDPTGDVQGILLGHPDAHEPSTPSVGASRTPAVSEARPHRRSRKSEHIDTGLLTTTTTEQTGLHHGRFRRS